MLLLKHSIRYTYLVLILKNTSQSDISLS